MKKILVFIFFAALLCLACKNEKNDVDNRQDKSMANNDADGESTDSLNDEIAENEDFESPEAMNQSSKNVSARGEISKVVVNQKFEIDKNGVGDVKIGMKVNELPDKVDGLYDKKTFESNGANGKVCMLYDGKNCIMEIDYDNKTNIIRSIRITSQSIKSKDGVYQFMDVKNLVKLPKLRQVLGNKSIDDLHEINVDGVVYEIEENVKGNKYVSAIVVEK